MHSSAARTRKRILRQVIEQAVLLAQDISRAANGRHGRRICLLQGRQSPRAQMIARIGCILIAFVLTPGLMERRQSVSNLRAADGKQRPPESAAQLPHAR